MISTYGRLKRRRDAGEIDGFTLIELLIVIVVLGILAAVVIFALGGITGKSQLAACQADGATVSTALAAYNAQNPGANASVPQLLGTGGGTEYIQSWPNATSYQYSLVGGQLYVAAAGVSANAITGTATTDWIKYAGPQTCATPVTSNSVLTPGIGL